jgi:hypothetical protein
MHTDKKITWLRQERERRLPSWSAVALHRFYRRIATAFPSSKAPEGWRSPKPGGSSHGSWKAPPETKSVFISVHWWLENFYVLILKRDKETITV